MAKIVEILETLNFWIVYLDNGGIVTNRKRSILTSDNELSTEEMLINEFCKMYKGYR